MKKVYLLGFILAATVAPWSIANAAETVAVGQAPAGCPKAFQGFHLGGNIGVGFLNNKNTVTRAEQQDNGTFVTERTYSHKQGGSGVDGGIGVGYTHRFSNWALGLAFDANWTNSSGTLKNTTAGSNTVSLKSQLENSLQLYARMGYVMREIAMPFIGLGWDNSQWKQNSKLVFAPTTADVNGVPTNFPGITETANKKKRFNAFLWKAGVDFLATKHVVVGFEYTGTVAGSKSVSKNVPNQFGGTEQIKASTKPQYNKFALTAKIVY